ncbi:MAG: sigma-70 family RNA polymerase sigma factor, partial [Clostridia bacterium]|nr:sigma-70 family RNA polymerase sigma factor [Clostridia bacterium]
MHFLSVPKENEEVDKLDKEKEIQRLMDTFGDDVLRTAYMFLKNRQSAEDAFQEVFVKVYNKLESFNHESSEKTWLLSITINVCKDLLKSSWIKRILLTDQISSRRSGSDIESRIIKKDENKRLFEEVLSLPPAFKEVIILFYYQSYD